MPQAPRKDNQSTRAQEKESKRARGALSCAECRRLKLKCDKTVPCSSCKRRGCSAICPNGSLITGQGTRFVLADTEKLHQKISHMSDRIRQLEDALAIAQSALAGPNGEPHPLLHRDLLNVKSSIELHSASTGTGEDGQDEDDEGDGEQYLDAFGTLAIRDDGAATFYGRSAGSESLLIGEASTASPLSSYSTVATPPTDNETSPPHRYLSASSSYADLESQPGPSSPANTQQDYYQAVTQVPLPASIVALASSFPLAPSLPPALHSSPLHLNPNEPVTLQMLITYYLPPYAEATRLIQLYLEQAPWFFGAVTSQQIESEIIPLWYGEAASANGVTSRPPPGGLSPSSAASPSSISSSSIGRQKSRMATSHDLALLFVIFCFGSLTDISLPSPPDNIPAERFYQLTKAALTLDPSAGADTKSSRNGILERPPSVATVQVLSLMAIYEGLCSGENSIESTWALMGLATKLSQSIGLHRDCARWKLTSVEVQKRRALFWELFITDCWQSLATGRLATYSLPFVDCELPFDPDQTIAEDGSTQPSFPYWKARFGAECVSAVVQGTLTSRAPKYSIILDLDRKVRDMELPSYAQGPPPQGLGMAQTMSHFMPLNYRELTLLYIHRCFFAHAISSNPLDPVKSQYAPSFLAGYRSACTIVASVKQQFTLFPAQIARFWVLWTHAFSASVMLASVATHASMSKIAPAALLELKNACDLFEAASGFGGRAGKFLPIMKRLQMKAQQAYRDANSGLPLRIPNDIFQPSQPDDIKDELSIFSGKTHTVSTKSTPARSSTHASGTGSGPATVSSSRGTSNAARSASDSPQLTDNPSFAGAHPSLVMELNSFNGLIKAQIQNAYRASGEVFGGGPMVVDPIRRVPAGQITAPPAPPPPPHQQEPAAVHQQNQQATYEQQQFEREMMVRKEAERQKRERQEFDRQEIERRQEFERQSAEREMLERQDLARQQQQQQQQQQDYQRQQVEHQEIQRQEEQRQQHAQQEQIRQEQAQQQMELRRQQEKTQQEQRREQYRQQLEIQQRQLEQERQQMEEGYQQQHRHAYQSTAQQPTYSTAVPDGQSIPVSSTRDSQMASLPPHGEHHRRPSHPRPISSLHQVHHQQQHYQPAAVAHHQQSSMSAPLHVTHPSISQTSITPQPTGAFSNSITQHTSISQNQHQQSQQSMYAIHPSEYPIRHSSSDSMHFSSTSSANYTPPSTYDHGHPSVPPTPNSVAYAPESYKYWPAASGSFAMPVDQLQTPYVPGSGHAHYHYTPEGALRGIAADDTSLQETWQTYMNKVGSPRQFLED